MDDGFTNAPTASAPFPIPYRPIGSPRVCGPRTQRRRSARDVLGRLMREAVLQAEPMPCPSTSNCPVPLPLSTPSSSDAPSKGRLRKAAGYLGRPFSSHRSRDQSILPTTQPRVVDRPIVIKLTPDLLDALEQSDGSDYDSDGEGDGVERPHDGTAYAPDMASLPV